MASILFVCTANQCRSVMAEHLMRRRVAAAGHQWSVHSAGTHVVPGSGAHPVVVDTMAQRGITVDPAWRSQRVTAAMIEDADLVLTATHRHLAHVLRLNPRAIKRAFALQQFARLLDADSGEEDVTHPSELIVLAARGRLLVQPRPRELDDIADPVGAPATEYRRCAETIDDAVASLARRISVVGPSRSSSVR